MSEHRELAPARREELLGILRARFAANMDRHAGLEWPNVQAKLDAASGKLWSLGEMERTGGAPDVIGFDPAAGVYLFSDCVAESPAGRRNLCYDRAALASRKKNRPDGSALELAASMGVALLTEVQYRHLQTLGAFDERTSSWVATPDAIRALGGALFCDRRFGHVFTYHNGAESYYSARGFRALLTV